ncbi:hypothetical protein BT63DRAFT_331662 [Microthyrium microscopicum]|uniref:Uncharacterized protein n=1 Tax=Microthyrium microscopicum TaxID=703497 RepID=A0A6A6U6A8_9PEZI|nr:hypothetical protein BT63DRAFT_331662 [Microthyrium microscopicum]
MREPDPDEYVFDAHYHRLRRKLTHGEHVEQLRTEMQQKPPLIHEWRLLYAILWQDLPADLMQNYIEPAIQYNLGWSRTGRNETCVHVKIKCWDEAVLYTIRHVLPVDVTLEELAEAVKEAWFRHDKGHRGRFSAAFQKVIDLLERFRETNFKAKWERKERLRLEQANLVQWKTDLQTIHHINSVRGKSRNEIGTAKRQRDGEEKEKASKRVKH